MCARSITFFLNNLTNHGIAYVFLVKNLHKIKDIKLTWYHNVSGKERKKKR